MTPDELKERLIAALDDWTETRDPCEHGHVEHTAADHVGRRIVHTMAGPFGADWDYDDAVAYIRSAIAMKPGAMLMGHVPVMGPDGRTVHFAVKRKRVGGADPMTALVEQA